MQLDIVSPDKNLFSGEVDSVIFPGAEGSFGILKDHAPLIATLTVGDIEISKQGGNETVAVNGGVVEVLKNKIIVLAE